MIHNLMICLGLYWILALALAKNRPCLQIWPKSDSGQNVAGFLFWRICKMVHTNTTMFHISTSFKKFCSWCCRIFVSFVYFVVNSPSSRDWWDLALWISIGYKEFRKQITNHGPGSGRFMSSNPALAKLTKPEAGTVLNLRDVMEMMI